MGGQWEDDGNGVEGLGRLPGAGTKRNADLDEEIGV
jgi:hypothetical protein